MNGSKLIFTALEVMAFASALLVAGGFFAVVLTPILSAA
jgi:hypothetical protein